MGLAASQCRLLSLTSRLSDLELRAQNLSNQKVALATATSAASNKYINALNNQYVNMWNPNGVYTQATADSLTCFNAATGADQLFLQNDLGQVMVNEDVLGAFKDSYNLKTGSYDFKRFAEDPRINCSLGTASTLAIGRMASVNTEMKGIEGLMGKISNANNILNGENSLTTLYSNLKSVFDVPDKNKNGTIDNDEIIADYQSYFIKDLNRGSKDADTATNGHGTAFFSALGNIKNALEENCAGNTYACNALEDVNAMYTGYETSVDKSTGKMTTSTTLDKNINDIYKNQMFYDYDKVRTLFGKESDEIQKSNDITVSGLQFVLGGTEGTFKNTSSGATSSTADDKPSSNVSKESSYTFTDFVGKINTAIHTNYFGSENNDNHASENIQGTNISQAYYNQYIVPAMALAEAAVKTKIMNETKSLLPVVENYSKDNNPENDSINWNDSVINAYKANGGDSDGDGRSNNKVYNINDTYNIDYKSLSHEYMAVFNAALSGKIDYADYFEMEPAVIDANTGEVTRPAYVKGAWSQNSSTQEITASTDFVPTWKTNYGSTNSALMKNSDIVYVSDYYKLNPSSAQSSADNTIYFHEYGDITLKDSRVGYSFNGWATAIAIGGAALLGGIGAAVVVGAGMAGAAIHDSIVGGDDVDVDEEKAPRFTDLAASGGDYDDIFKKSNVRHYKSSIPDDDYEHLFMYGSINQYTYKGGRYWWARRPVYQKVSVHGYTVGSGLNVSSSGGTSLQILSDDALSSIYNKIGSLDTSFDFKALKENSMVFDASRILLTEETLSKSPSVIAGELDPQLDNITTKLTTSNEKLQVSKTKKELYLGGSYQKLSSSDFTVRWKNNNAPTAVKDNSSVSSGGSVTYHLSGNTTVEVLDKQGNVITEYDYTGTKTGLTSSVVPTPIFEPSKLNGKQVPTNPGVTYHYDTDYKEYYIPVSIDADVLFQHIKKDSSGNITFDSEPCAMSEMVREEGDVTHVDFKDNYDGHFYLTTQSTEDKRKTVEVYAGKATYEEKSGTVDLTDENGNIEAIEEYNEKVITSLDKVFSPTQFDVSANTDTAKQYGANCIVIDLKGSFPNDMATRKKEIEKYLFEVYQDKDLSKGIASYFGDQFVEAQNNLNEKVLRLVIDLDDAKSIPSNKSPSIVSFFKTTLNYTDYQVDNITQDVDIYNDVEAKWGQKYKEQLLSWVNGLESDLNNANTWFEKLRDGYTDDDGNYHKGYIESMRDYINGDGTDNNKGLAKMIMDYVDSLEDLEIDANLRSQIETLAYKMQQKYGSPSMMFTEKDLEDFDADLKTINALLNKASSMIEGSEPDESKIEYYQNIFNAIKLNGAKAVSNDKWKDKEWLNEQLLVGNIHTSVGEDGYLEQRPYSSFDYISIDTLNDEMISRAQAEYEAEVNRISKKEKKIDRELSMIENEHTALENKVEEIKSVKDKNIERNFNLFS